MSMAQTWTEQNFKVVNTTDKTKQQQQQLSWLHPDYSYPSELGTEPVIDYHHIYLII